MYNVQAREMCVMMEYYNNELKQAFLSYLNNGNKCAHNVRLVNTLFKQAKRVEVLLNRDLYTFTDTEVLLVLKEYDALSIPYCRQIRTYINKYFNFCIMQKLCKSANRPMLATLQVQQLGYDNLVYNMYYKDYMHMMEVFDTVTYNSMCTLTEYVKIYISLVFYGFPRNDLVNISVSDINVQNCTIYSHELQQEIGIPNEVIGLCYNLFNMYGTRKVGNNRLIYRTDYKNFSDDFISHQMARFNVLWKECISDLPYYQKEQYMHKIIDLAYIAKNGILYKCYLNEKQKGKYKNSMDMWKRNDLDGGANTIVYTYRLYRLWKDAYKL